MKFLIVLSFLILVTAEKRALALELPQGLSILNLDYHALVRGKLEISSYLTGGTLSGFNPADNNILAREQAFVFAPLGGVASGVEDMACKAIGLDAQNREACQIMEVSAFVRFDGHTEFSPIGGRHILRSGVLLSLPENADRVETYLVVTLGRRTGCRINLQNFSSAPTLDCTGPTNETQEIYISNFGKIFLIQVQ
jgi:hypothetical protein